MRIVFDIEANGLYNPTRIWVVVCKDIDNDRLYIFREGDRDEFISFTRDVSLWIGHNILEYDFTVLNRLWHLPIPSINTISDTLIGSRLNNYSRQHGHSLEAYGEEFGIEKFEHSDWSQWSQRMEDRCVRDVAITHKVYNSLRHIFTDATWASSIRLEQEFQLVLNGMRNHGFGFDNKRALALLTKVKEDLDEIDQEIKEAYPQRLSPIREITPRATKFGTINKSDFRWSKTTDLSDYSPGCPFTLCHWVTFNPASHKQVVDVLQRAGWAPSEKTRTAIAFDREGGTPDKRIQIEKYGWKVNETNLATLPETAPRPARLLAKRILLESRRRTLVEWSELVKDSRIYGKFNGIGAWTHRMAHQEPNTANIPNEYQTNGSVKLLGKEMRALWQAPRNRLLVGVDAEGIQLRIFAHYIDDKEFTESLVKGDSHAGTDPHSLNKSILGSVCKTRDAAKCFIYALLLGAGIRKLAEVLGCSEHEAEIAIGHIMERYQGFSRLKKTIIPNDAKRGWFLGLDGRRVPIPGETVSERRHLCMSGYLQNGEAIVIKEASINVDKRIQEYDSFLVDIIHDELQAETPNNMGTALSVAKIMDEEIVKAGERFKLKCPMKGSYWSKRHKDYSIGKNWWYTH